MSGKKYGKIVKKIKGLLAIAKDEKNDEESQSAFILAQRLMIQYNIDKKEFDFAEFDTEDIESESVTIYKKLFWWERTLGGIIAENFRVKMYYTSKNTGHKTKIVFYGYGSDLELAKEMYFLAYEVLLFHSKQYIENWYLYYAIERTRKNTEKIKSSYINGFLSGLNKRFAEQVSSLKHNYEVMVLIPKEVEDSYKKLSDDFGNYNVSIPPVEEQEAYIEGFVKAKEIDFTRSTIDTI